MTIARPVTWTKMLRLVWTADATVCGNSGRGPSALPGWGDISAPPLRRAVSLKKADARLLQPAVEGLILRSGDGRPYAMLRQLVFPPGDHLGHGLRRVP